VETSEAARRIFWRHRWLLLILMILPAAAVVALKEHQPVNYAATSTIQGQGTTPDAPTQVTAIQSRVSAIATNPALVQTVINQERVNRNALQVAQHAISVTPLGTSAIMTITVTDRSPKVAVDLAGLLANAVATQLDQVGVNGNPELAQLRQTNSELTARRNQLLSQLGTANASNAAGVAAQQQLAAVEQELSSNESQIQQVLGALTTETGAAVISVAPKATAASRHAAVDGALAALLGLVVGLLIVTIREIIWPTVAQPGAGARELGAVLLGSAEASGDNIIRLDRELPELLNLAAHRAGVLTIVLTGPGSHARLSALAARLRDELPTPERADARSSRAWAATRIDHGHAGDDSGPNGDVRRKAVVEGGHRAVGLATDRASDIAAAWPSEPQRTVVTLDDIRLGSPPPDAALVVVLPRFAPHSALDQAADLGITADWPILGVIGIRRQRWLAGVIAQRAAPPAARAPGERLPDARAPEAREADTVPLSQAPDNIHMEREDD
jgi:capsular polysaccharide biosynthesis protein